MSTKTYITVKAIIPEHLTPLERADMELHRIGLGRAASCTLTHNGWFVSDNLSGRGDDVFVLRLLGEHPFSLANAISLRNKL